MITIDLTTALHKQMSFCENNERYKCGVYVKHSDRKKIVMEVISNLLPIPNKEVKLVMSLGMAEARYRNGSIIRIISGNDSARMQRFNGVIIDNDLDNEIINCIIMPTLKPMMINFEKYEEFKEVDKRIFSVSISMDDIYKSEKYKQTYPSDSEVIKMLQEQRKMLNNICFKNGEYIKLEKEYEMFVSNEYNTAIRTIEKDNNKIFIFNALGIPKENIEYKTEFVNKSKESYLVIQGSVELTDINYENGINVRMKIDTDIYDGYDVCIENGLIFVRLHEIINEAPVLKDYGVA